MKVFVEGEDAWSSYLEEFCKQGFLKNCVESIEKYMCRSLF